MALHETTLTMYDAKGSRIGEIDVQIEYVVTSSGSPARIHYDENDHPAEAGEIDVVHVSMLNAPAPNNAKPRWIPCWDWLYDTACAWADENASDLAAKARLEAVA